MKSGVLKVKAPKLLRIYEGLNIVEDTAVLGHSIFFR
jgi:hypothetical protein